jgi:hypothetical protein
MNPNKNCHVQSPQTHLPGLLLPTKRRKVVLFTCSSKKKSHFQLQTIPSGYFNVAMGNGPFIKMLYLLKMVDLSMANC